MMGGDLLGCGWSFPVTAEVGYASGEARIRQSIWMILSTAPGERVMRPDFGCGIHDYVFANLTDALIGRLTHQVSEALTRWEPRIALLGVFIAPNTEDPNRLDISIDYQVRSTNNSFNLIYPFYKG